MTRQWFEEDFFDAGYIEAWEAAGRFESTPDDARALVDLLNSEGARRVLDIPCGFGRFAGPLHEGGFDVTGADLSQEQLDIAQREAPGPRYIRADMREPPQGSYDAVCNLFSSFGYFASVAEDRRALEAWFQVTKPGGLLVIETTHRDQIAAWEAQSSEHDGPLFEVTTTNWETGIREAVFTYDGISRWMRMRMYTATELVALCRGVGYEGVNILGDWGRLPLSPTSRLLLCARRPV